MSAAYGGSPFVPLVQAADASADFSATSVAAAAAYAHGSASAGSRSKIRCSTAPNPRTSAPAAPTESAENGGGTVGSLPSTTASSLSVSTMKPMSETARLVVRGPKRNAFVRFHAFHASTHASRASSTFAAVGSEHKVSIAVARLAVDRSSST